MSKQKRSKSGSKYSDGDKWMVELMQTNLSQEDWRAVVFVLVPHHSSENNIVSLINESVSGRTRKLFSAVDCSLLLVEAKELAHQYKGSRGKPPTGAPRFREICDMAVEQGDVLPAMFLAKLIKFKLLMLKDKDLARRARESKNNDDSEPASQLSGQTKTQTPSKGGKKNKKDDATQEVQSQKKTTKLKKRGEEVEEIETIDDEPSGLDDPHHYFVVTGVKDTAILAHLADINVQVNAIVQVSIKYHLKQQSAAEISSVENIIENDTVASSSADDVSDSLETELQKFWTDSDKMATSAPAGHILADMAKFHFIVEDDCIPDGDVNSLNTESKAEFGGYLFDRLAQICYDMLVHRKHYELYIDQLKIVDVSLKPIHVLLPSNHSSTANLLEDDLRYYKKLLSVVPMESDSVATILDCLLEQVCASVDKKNPTEDIISSEDQNKGLIEGYLDVMLSNSGLSSEKDKWSCKSKRLRDELVYYGHNSKLRRLNIREDSCAFDSEQRITNLHPYSEFISYLTQSTVECIESMIHRKQLHRNSDLSEDELERALLQYVFECLPLLCVSESGDVTENSQKDEQHAKISGSWDDPYFDKRGIEKDNIFLKNLDAYCWSEKFEKNMVFEVLDNRCQVRPFMDIYHNRGSNKILLVLTNPVGGSSFNTATWTGWLHSNVGFRNYLENVADELCDWTQHQIECLEAQKKAEIPQQSSFPTVVNEVVKEKSRYGLKTRSEIQSEKEEEAAKVAKSLTPQKRQSPSAKNTSTKRSKHRPTSQQTGSAKSSVGSKDIIPKEEAKYSFLGYNLGNEMLHLTSTQSYLFAKKGYLVKVDNVTLITGKQTIRVTLLKEGNVFSLDFIEPRDLSHCCQEENVIGEASVSPTQTEQPPSLPSPSHQPCSSSSLTVTFTDGMTLVAGDSLTDDNKGDVTASNCSAIVESERATSASKKPKGKKKDDKQEEHERLLKEEENGRKLQERKNQVERFYNNQVALKNLYLSTSDGVKVSFSHGVVVNDYFDLSKNPKYFFIKMETSQLREDAKTLEDLERVKELKRCVTQDGAVIRYLSDDTVEVLFPDGHLLKGNSKTTSVEMDEANTEKFDEKQFMKWHTVYADGKQHLDGNSQLNDMISSTIKCLETSKVLVTREDGVMIVKDGSEMIVEYCDGTRISQSNDVIKIQHQDFPTISARKDKLTVEFQNGRAIEAFHDGGYCLYELTHKELEIDCKGNMKVCGVSSSQENPFEKTLCNGDYSLHPGVFHLHQNDEKPGLHFEDLDGGLCTVDHFGGFHVESNQPNPAPSPCYFIIHPDGSGEELLRYDDVQAYLEDAEQMKDAAIMRDSLGGGSTAITIIKPAKHSNKRTSLDCIIPEGLRESNFKSLPSSGCKRTEPTAVSEPIRGGLFEVRHLTQHPPFDATTREKVMMCVERYGGLMRERKAEEDSYKITDRRGEEEIRAAEQVLKEFQEMKKKTTEDRDIENEQLIEQYITSIRPPTPPPQEVKKPACYPEERWEKERMELERFKQAKCLMNSEKLPPYFQTEEGQRFLLGIGVLPDLNRLSNEMAYASLHPSVPSVESDESSHVTPEDSSTEKLIPRMVNLSSQSIFGSTSISPFDSDASLSYRPLNPTPKEAAFTPVEKDLSAETKLTTIPEFADKRLVKNDDNVANKQKLNERSRVRTSSVAGAVNKDLTARMRGFLLTPDLVDFGILTEGGSYSFVVLIKNIGVESSRFNVTQPPPSTGLNVVHKPGPVAAGMSRQLNIRIFAVAVGVEGNNGVGQISHSLVIHSEMDTFYLPIIATIVTQSDRDMLAGNGPSKGTLTLEHQAVSRDGVQRRKK